MPQKAHTNLKKSAKKRGLKGKQADRYVYGALAKMKPQRNSGRKR